MKIDQLRHQLVEAMERDDVPYEGITPERAADIALSIFMPRIEEMEGEIGRLREVMRVEAKGARELVRRGLMPLRGVYIGRGADCADANGRAIADRLEQALKSNYRKIRGSCLSRQQGTGEEGLRSSEPRVFSITVGRLTEGWSVVRSEVPGLNIEGATKEEVEREARNWAGELLVENKVVEKGSPVALVFHYEEGGEK